MKYNELVLLKEEILTYDYTLGIMIPNLMEFKASIPEEKSFVIESLNKDKMQSILKVKAEEIIPANLNIVMEEIYQKYHSRVDPMVQDKDTLESKITLKGTELLLKENQLENIMHSSSLLGEHETDKKTNLNKSHRELSKNIRREKIKLEILEEKLKDLEIEINKNKLLWERSELTSIEMFSKINK